MRNPGTFELVVERETEARPMRVTVAVSGGRVDEQGRVLLTPACMTLDDLEGCLNVLADEIDVLRAEARRAFSNIGSGHA